MRLLHEQEAYLVSGGVVVEMFTIAWVVGLIGIGLTHGLFFWMLF